MANLFERLNKDRPQPIKKPIKGVTKKHGTDPKTLLMDVLANGPVPATIVEARGAAHGITRKQLRRARERMGIVPFKETGKINGRWLWALPPHNPTVAAPPDAPSSRAASPAG